MLRWFFGISLSVLVAAVVAGGLVWYTDRPSTYHECVLSEMRGQNSVAMPTVERVCAIRFHKEDELPLSYLNGRIDLHILPDFDKDPDVALVGSKNFDNPPMVFMIFKNDTEYNVTRLKFKYSHKLTGDCSDVADDEWHDGPDVVFKDNKANVDMPGEYDPKTQRHRAPWCYHYTDLYGVLRKQ